MYPVIAEPPLEAGAVHVTVALALPPTPATAVGAPGADGGAVGVTGAEAGESALGPTPLVATTLNVYAVPLVSPVTSQVSGPVVHEHVCGCRTPPWKVFTV